MLDLPRLVAESDIGSIAKVQVWRKNKILEIKVKLGELPEKSYSNEKILKEESNEINFDDLNISISATNNNEGVLVTKTNEKIDLLVGDVIIEVNREKITTTISFVKLVKNIKKTGRTSLLLKILRDNKSFWITVKFSN